MFIYCKKPLRQFSYPHVGELRLVDEPDETLKEAPEHDKISGSILDFLLRYLKPFFDPSKLDKEKPKALRFEDGIDIFI